MSDKSAQISPDSKSLQLLLQELFVCQRLEDVKADEYERGRPGHSDDLPTSTLAVLSTLDNSGQVKQLDLGALVPDATRNCVKQGKRQN